MKKSFFEKDFSLTELTKMTKTSITSLINNKHLKIYIKRIILHR